MYLQLSTSTVHCWRSMGKYRKSMGQLLVTVNLKRDGTLQLEICLAFYQKQSQLKEYYTQNKLVNNKVMHITAIRLSLCRVGWFEWHLLKYFIPFICYSYVAITPQRDWLTVQTMYYFSLHECVWNINFIPIYRYVIIEPCLSAYIQTNINRKRREKKGSFIYYPVW